MQVKIFNQWMETRTRQIHVWLDDVRPMPSEFNVHVKTAREAILLLNKGDVSSISLDHDLGPSDETGYSVAKYIEEHAYYGDLPRLKVMIHTDNPEGRRNMMAAINNAERYWRQHEESAHKGQ